MKEAANRVSSDVSQRIMGISSDMKATIRPVSERAYSQMNSYFFDTSHFTISPKKMMNVNLGCQFLASVGFAISSFFVATFANVGFNIVATGIANSLFACAGLLVVNRIQDPGSVGLIIGAGAVICFLSLLTAIYWGQLSRCQVVTVDISNYTCKNKSAMKSGK